MTGTLVEYVSAGQEVSPKSYGDIKVGEACALPTFGHHYCVTHDRHCTNNMDRASHAMGSAKHLFGWWCNEHGLEAYE